ncbi:MAG: type IV pilus assembly protein PilM [Candidatus Latescibacteria bacterium]|nr:type IV pilus assembly protein PilM [Candidatus Latescibacterota bacterium]
MKFFRKQETTIGLDIGTSVIKAAKVSHKGDVMMLESYAVEPLEEGTVQAGEIKNPSSLAQSALNAVNQCGAGGRQVVVALPSFSILSDILVMDLIPEKNMREAVMIEAERIYPFDMSEVKIDFSVLERDEENKKMKILMVAAKQELILSYIDFLNEAGLQPTIFDVDLFALANIFHLNYDAGKYESCILLNIGTESTVAAFLQNGVYHSSRDISVAGSSFITELEYIPDMTPEKIFDITMGTVDPELDANAVAAALNKAGNEFAGAVNTAVSYFQASDNVGKLDLIVLTGGYAWTPGLINILEMRTGAEVIVLDPFLKIGYNEEAMAGVDPGVIGSKLTVAMGLATRVF